MLTVVRDAEGQLQVACEWWLVDDTGKQNWDTGAYVWVEQVELSTGASRTLWGELIALIAFYAPTAKGAYWIRRDKTGTKLHAFTRSRLLTLYHQAEEVRL